jgi:galactokinase
MDEEKFAPAIENHAANAIADRFRALFGAEPQMFRAPGRVNLIGEHTDYNDGFVMPAAVGFYTYVAAAKNKDRLLRVYSEQFGESIEFAMGELTGPPRKHWSDYVRGVATELLEAGCALEGANLLVDGQVPLGAGLSSSAAIEVATALALSSLAGVDADRVELAKLCQRAENRYSGAQCGIMDQFISCFGTVNHALLLDCRSLSVSLLPLPEGARLVICNTMTKHALAGGEYNQRRASCERAVKTISKSMPKVRALRDVSLPQLERHRSLLDEVDYRRCRHVVTENARVTEAAAALVQENLNRFGELMYQSHASLDKDYEVTCEELNLMVQLARERDGVYGARMTGGGFGGSTVNLVEAGKAEAFRSEIVSRYETKTGIRPEVYICSASDGAASVPLR